MREPLTLHDGELSWLLGQSTGPDRAVETNLGPAAPVLRDTEVNAWAYDALLERRHVLEIPSTAWWMAVQEAQGSAGG